MSLNCSTSVGLFTVVCLLGGMTGCGSSSSATSGAAREARGALKVLGIEYSRFVTEHNGRPPADKEQLMAFLQKRKDRIPGLKDVAQLMASSRDSKPLVIFYGKSMPSADESGFPAVAREAIGVDGQCLVANTRGGVQEIAISQLPPHLTPSN